jgi:hypothetical protein
VIQSIVPLSGRWFVESMDGVRTEMGPGDVSADFERQRVTARMTSNRISIA